MTPQPRPLLSKLNLCTCSSSSSSNIALEVKPTSIDLLTSRLETILEERLIEVVQEIVHDDNVKNENASPETTNNDGGGGGGSDADVIKVTSDDTPNNNNTNKQNNDDNDEDGEYGHFKLSAVEYVARNDAHWLKSRPPVCSLQTILCIPEDYQYYHGVNNNNQSISANPLDSCDPPLQVTVYHRPRNNNIIKNGKNIDMRPGNTGELSQSSCCCGVHARPPLDAWERKSRHQQENQRQVNANGNTDINTPVKLSWVDLRQAQSIATNSREQRQQHPARGSVQVNSQAGALHFLRSLLGSSHGVSPWTPSKSEIEGDEKKQTEQQDLILPNESDIVVTVVDYPIVNRQVLDFRVSDAAPSWYLHCVVALDCLELDFNISDATMSHEQKPPPATLLVYKRLSQRLFLSPTTPPEQSILRLEDETNSDNADIPSLPDGCLWETVVFRKDKETQDDAPEYFYRPTVPPYISLMQDYSQAMELFEPQCLQAFAEEASRIPHWIPWPETQHYSSQKAPRTANNSSARVQHEAAKPWTVVPLCHCFPANQIEKFQWIDLTKQQCPQTCRILESVLGTTLRTALFSQLAPNTTLEPHTGWSDLANHVLRLHIPLVVPGSDHDGGLGLCGTWVDGCVESHVTGRPLLFDDSKLHRAFNYSDQPRIVLIVDLERPAWLPVGYATGGHSEELDKFIRQMALGPR